MRYEVYWEDDTGGALAAFRYLDDARAYASQIDGLVYDVQQEAGVTYYPLDPARVGGHDLRPGRVMRRKVCAGLKVGAIR